VAVGVGVGVGVGVAVGVGGGVTIGIGVGVGVGDGVGVSVSVKLEADVGVGVGVGVGDGAATTLKLTAIEAPLLPVAPVELHGVATNVWVPIALGAHVKSKGVAESVFMTRASLLNTTLFVFLFACAVTV
jgi:hypothetical protein